MKKILFSLLLIIIFVACDDCEFTIDSYEVLTGMDIPKTTRVDCEYDSERKIKITVFELEMANFNIEEYAAKYDFQLVATDYEVDFEGMDLLFGDDTEFPPNKQLYIRKGRNKKNGKNYQYLLDIETGKMWGEIVQKP
ncbi:MAG: hypothetical protein AB8G11_08835 [Saprospiraceae bacterium]